VASPDDSRFEIVDNDLESTRLDRVRQFAHAACRHHEAAILARDEIGAGEWLVLRVGWAILEVINVVHNATVRASVLIVDDA